MPELELTERQVKTVKVYYAPCIKCGGTDIVFDDAGESSFNYASGKCKTCKHEVSLECGISINKKEIISVWNSQNDLEMIANRKLTEALNLKLHTIPTLQAQAKALKKLKEQRDKKQPIIPLKKVSSKGGKYAEPKIDKFELAENVFLEIKEKGTVL